jgi:hypothetical protein
MEQRDVDGAHWSRANRLLELAAAAVRHAGEAACETSKAVAGRLAQRGRPGRADAPWGWLEPMRRSAVLSTGSRLRANPLAGTPIVVGSERAAADNNDRHCRQFWDKVEARQQMRANGRRPRLASVLLLLPPIWRLSACVPAAGRQGRSSSAMTSVWPAEPGDLLSMSAANRMPQNELERPNSERADEPYWLGAV